MVNINKKKLQRGHNYETDRMFGETRKKNNFVICGISLKVIQSIVTFCFIF